VKIVKQITIFHDMFYKIVQMMTVKQQFIEFEAITACGIQVNMSFADGGIVTDFWVHHAICCE